MARVDTQTELADAAKELQCIAEIMLTLAETPAQIDGRGTGQVDGLAG